MISTLRKRLAQNLACSMMILFLCINGAPENAHAEVHLWPLFESTETSTTILYPFYVQEKDFTMVFPFYYGAREGNEQHFLWPLVKIADGRLARVTPIWFSEREGSFFLFPLVMKKDDRFLSVFPPIYYEKGTNTLAVMPLFSKMNYINASDGESNKSLSVLWPLYSKKEVRTSDGALLSRKRRWLLFTDELKESGTRKIRFLGIPVSESIS